MKMQKKSISRALIELKTLEKRIEKAIGDFSGIGFIVGKKLPSGYNTIEEMEVFLKGQYQQIVDLIKNRNAIKLGVLKANSIAKVKINDEEMTIMQAIERKKSIELDKKMLEKLKINFVYTKNLYEKKENENKIRLDKLIETLCGKEASKIKEEEYENISRPFRAENDPKIIDPLDFEKIITKMEEMIDNFMAEVDIAINEANVRNDIEY